MHQFALEQQQHSIHSIISKKTMANNNNHANCVYSLVIIILIIALSTVSIILAITLNNLVLNQQPTASNAPKSDVVITYDGEMKAYQIKVSHVAGGCRLASESSGDVCTPILLCLETMPPDEVPNTIEITMLDDATPPQTVNPPPPPITTRTTFLEDNPIFKIHANSSNETIRKSITYHTEDEWKESPILDQFRDVCGRRNSSTQELIVGGIPVPEIGDSPWTAALFFSDRYICVANLITDKLLITAAHCVINRTASDLSIQLGHVTLDDFNSLRVGIAKIVANKHFVHGKAQHDVAILEMQTRVKFTRAVRPICLWDRNLSTELVNGTVSGWGRTLTNIQSMHLQKIKMPIVDNLDCLYSNPQFAQVATNLTYCAGSRNETGPCSGDSGAGFVVTDANKVAHLRGIVSTSLAKGTTCNLKEYVVFADVRYEMVWIKNVIEMLEE